MAEDRRSCDYTNITCSALLDTTCFISPEALNLGMFGVLQHFYSIMHHFLVQPSNHLPPCKPTVHWLLTPPKAQPIRLGLAARLAGGAWRASITRWSRRAAGLPWSPAQAFSRLEKHKHRASIPDAYFLTTGSALQQVHRIQNSFFFSFFFFTPPTQRENS